MLLPSALILFASVFINLYFIFLRWEYPYISVYHIILCVIALFLQMSLSQNGRLTEKNEYMAHLFEKEQMYQKLSEESINAINLKCHDMKKQLETISKINSPESLKEYKNEIAQSIADYDMLAETGNNALDIAISERIPFCRSRNIKFTFMADGKLADFISSPDLYSMAGNALDNCIEAVMKLGEAERVVTMKLFEENGMVCMQFENYFDGKLAMRDGSPATSKSDTISHGFGIKSIRMIAKKYNGTVTISCEDNIFDLNILFPSSH